VAHKRLAPDPSQHPLTPTPDVWVSRNKLGQLVAVRVADMEPSHILRWLNYFRTKYRGLMQFATDEQVDTVIMKTMVTAPAIYLRAVQLGIIQRPGGDAGAMLPPTEQRTMPDALPVPGRRLMRFEEE